MRAPLNGADGPNSAGRHRTGSNVSARFTVVVVVVVAVVGVGVRESRPDCALNKIIQITRTCRMGEAIGQCAHLLRRGTADRSDPAHTGHGGVARQKPGCNRTAHYQTMYKYNAPSNLPVWVQWWPQCRQQRADGGG